MDEPDGAQDGCVDPRLVVLEHAAADACEENLPRAVALRVFERGEQCRFVGRL